MIFLHTINFYKKHTTTFISTPVIRSGESNFKVAAVIMTAPLCRATLLTKGQLGLNLQGKGVYPFDSF